MAKLRIVTGDTAPLEIEIIRLFSYVNDSSSGTITSIGEEFLGSVNGKHVLIVEDIIDTGRSMKKLFEILESYSPATIAVASLLVKKLDNGVQFIPEFSGFEIPNKFVVGCFFDYNNNFREVPHACVMNDLGIETFKETK